MTEGKIHVLDTRHLGRPGIIAATAIETQDGLALFDVGPESTFDNVVADLSRIGCEPKDVRHVFLSHIHFDHAGAAWRFAELGAGIYVHPRGAPHLLNPTKLVESATRIFGEDMERLWGHFAPVPQERLHVLEDGQVTQIGALEIQAIATPGHASHHHVYHWEDSLFGGDVAGVRIGNGPPIPPFVPPELDVEAWEKSIAKMRGLDAARLYLPHYGLVQGSVGDHLDDLRLSLHRWAEWFHERIRKGEEKEQLTSRFADYEAEELHNGGATESESADYEAADPSYMAVSAALRYWGKRRAS